MRSYTAGMKPTWAAFRPELRGTFVDRPNRFVVRALTVEGLVEAHCPNPGRMTELLLPGVTVVLERAAPGRKLGFTLVALERSGDCEPVTVPLVSVRANDAVGTLVLPRLFPQARVLRPEFALEGSRFDWMVEDAHGQRHLVEVKACSEVEYGTALFPDAPSLRATKHLEELAQWAGGYRPHVVFAVVHGDPRSFGPNVHTDPVFARTLKRLADRIDLRAVVFETSPDGQTTVRTADLPLDLSQADAPDEGLIVRWDRREERWTLRVEDYPTGWAKALSRAPARQSFSLRCPADWAEALVADLSPLVRDSDPSKDPAVIDTVMRWRHGARSSPNP